jgi:hypothetical protein
MGLAQTTFANAMLFRRQMQGFYGAHNLYLPYSQQLSIIKKVRK